jgi:hypothetical protein
MRKNLPVLWKKFSPKRSSYFSILKAEIFPYGIKNHPRPDCRFACHCGACGLVAVTSFSRNVFTVAEEDTFFRLATDKDEVAQAIAELGPLGE